MDMSVQDSRFTLPVAKQADALVAVKAAVKQNDGYFGDVLFYHPDFYDLTHVALAMRQLGWLLLTDGQDLEIMPTDVDVNGIDMVEGFELQLTDGDRIIFSALAPLLADGDFIQFNDTDNGYEDAVYRWTVFDGKFYYQDPIVSWPEIDFDNARHFSAVKL